MGTEKSFMIRMSDANKEYLQELAKRRQQSMTKVIEDMLEEHRRLSFFEELDSAYKALRADPKAWKEELEDDALWDQALSDGLEDE